ncbi:MAG: pyridoxamine 5'-phosphate oxidase family protein [Christensenellales bacterium]|jgi:uncharacterized pyridoxamine 5'-phosphate oxidase family protein
MEKVLAFLKENATFYFTTLDGDQPRVRPFGFVMEYDGMLCFAVGEHKATYAQLLKNPNVEICAANQDRQWMRLRGRAVVVTSEKCVRKAFGIEPMLKELYNKESGLKLGIIGLEEAEVEFACMDGAFEKYKL